MEARESEPQQNRKLRCRLPEQGVVSGRPPHGTASLSRQWQRGSQNGNAEVSVDGQSHQKTDRCDDGDLDEFARGGKALFVFSIRVMAFVCRPVPLELRRADYKNPVASART